MAKRRRRTGKTWRSLVWMLIAAATAFVYKWDDLVGIPAGDKARIFAAFADMDMSPSLMSRIRGVELLAAAKPLPTQWRVIQEVTDGDSLVLNGGEKVRLIGIDAPESSVNAKLYRDIGRMGGGVKTHELVALGREAAERLRVAAEGKRCWLSYDSSQTDQYGRTLAYVALEDGTVLNEMMLVEGYARVFLSERFKHRDRYVYLQVSARLNKRGFWAGGEEGMVVAAR